MQKRCKISDIQIQIINTSVSTGVILAWKDSYVSFSFSPLCSVHCSRSSKTWHVCVNREELSSLHTLFLLCCAVLCCCASLDSACTQRADACRLRWARKRCILRRCFTAVNENTANSGMCRRENLYCGNTTILYKLTKKWGKVLFSSRASSKRTEARRREIPQTGPVPKCENLCFAVLTNYSRKQEWFHFVF